MKIEQLDCILEALLFISGDGLKISEVCDAIDVQRSEINSSIKRLKAKYGGDCGINLIVYNGKIQFGSNPAYSDVVSAVLNPIKERELSKTALETVAIIAYSQPITRLDIETIRGVNCDYALQVLMKNNLIEVVGRKDAIGKPLLFGTTDEFLKRFKIEDISQLPDYEKLLDNLRVIENERSTDEESTTDLYNRDVPEFLQGEEIAIIESGEVAATNEKPNEADENKE